jgi:hypothetical protein
MLFSAVLAAMLFTSGCTVRAGYAYRGDDHRWNNHEAVYYNQWETETHRHHTDYDKRSHSEQDSYWKWRHDHH